MTSNRISIIFILVASLFCAGQVMAYQHDAVEKENALVSKASADKIAKSKAKAKARAKLVDINSASKASLMKLPGITAALADKIIANRPYGSKTWLLTNNVIEAGAYSAVQSLVQAKQPFKTAEENAAMYEKLKNEKKAKP